MALTQTQVSQLFVSIFNRASEGTANTYWQTAHATGTTTAEQMFLLPVVATYFNVTNFTDAANVRTVIETIYLNALGKAPADDVAGINYWVAQVAAGRSIGDVVNTLVIAATDVANAGVAQDTFNNKVTVSNFAADTLPALSTAAAFQAFLTNVTNVASTVTTATDSVTAAVPVVSTPGETFTLTTSVDTMVGTANDDVFNAVQSAAATETYSIADTIQGGLGNDTLNLISEEGAAVNGAIVEGIEVLNYRAAVAGGDIDMANFTGVTTLNANRWTGATNATNIAITTGVTVTKATATFDASLTFLAAGVTGGTDVATVTISEVAAGADLALVGAVETVNFIVNTGAASIADLDLDAGTTTVTIAADETLTATNQFTSAGVTSLTVTGDSLVTLGTLANATVTVTSAGSTGGLSAVLGTSVVIAATGGDGDDSFTTGSAITTGSINGGNGTDTLTIANNAHLTATIGARYTNFETLGVLNAVTVDMDHIAGITAIALTDVAGTTVINDMTATQAANITAAMLNGASTLAVKGAANVGQIDTVHITVNDGDTTLSEDLSAIVANLTLASIETLKVTAVDDAEITQSAATSGALTSVTLDGAGNHFFITGNMATANFSLNASASTGANTLNAATFATNGLAITGGSAVDTITGSVQADIIIGGAGADVIQTTAVGANVGAADAITGGAGFDTFSLVGDVAAATGATSSYTTIANISDFTVGTAATDTDLLRFSSADTAYSDDAPGTAGLSDTEATNDAAGAVIVQEVSASNGAAAGAAGMNYIKLTTSTAYTTGTQAMFNAAIGSSTVTGLIADSVFLVSYHDATNLKMVLLAADANAGAATSLETADVVRMIATVDMTAADYALIDADNFAAFF